MIEMDAEAPAETHDREFNEHKPDTARQQKAADLADRPALPVQKCRNSRQKNESWRAEMRHPTRQEQRRIAHVAGIEATGPEKVTCVMTRPRSKSIDVRRVRPTAAGVFLTDVSSTGDTGCRASKATFMTSFLPRSSCVGISRLVAERGSTLKTRGHQNICLRIQGKVMDEKPRISVGNQRQRQPSATACAPIIPAIQYCRAVSARPKTGAVTIGC